MMEGEGSGYDLIYELNAMEAKDPPMIESSYNEVTVIQNAEIIDTEAASFAGLCFAELSVDAKGIYSFWYHSP